MRIRRSRLPHRPIRSAPAKLELDSVADLDTLRTIWKRSIRKAHAKWRLRDLVLAHAPLDLVPIDWDIDAFIGRLRASILDGSYRPQTPQVVRSAKGNGLTRPLCILTPEDQLVFKAVVGLAEADLMRGMQDWTRFGRADRAADDSSLSSDSGWFRAWLARQGHLWTIIENHKWVVETDIANFFPSVQLPFLLAHVQARSRLGEAPVRLLARILEDVSVLPEFRKSATIGLPQENFDCSRVLAHTHLRIVDDAFAAEGSKNRFSRYMDDVVIGADTKEEATRYVARIQGAMERIGLYPNTAKTRIVRSAVFRGELMKPENDLIGELEDEFKADAEAAIAHTTVELGQFLRARSRPRGWERVLRRWYTLCRMQRHPLLLRHALEHLSEFPSSGPNILDYLTVFTMNANRLRRLFVRIDGFGGVYENLEILAAECVAQAPGSDTDRFRAVVAEVALRRLTASRSPWVAASSCVTLGKYGRRDDFEALYRLCQQEPQQAPWKLQALMILLGSGTVEAGRAIREWRDRFPQAREVAFIEAVCARERRAVQMLADFVAPREALTPHRWVVRARSLFLIPLLAQADPRLWEGRSNAWTIKLKSNPVDLVDRAGWRWWRQRL